MKALRYVLMVFGGVLTALGISYLLTKVGY